jgi:Bacterial PH domain
VSGNSSIARGRGIPARRHDVFRLTTPVVLWWVWVVFAVANITDLLIQGSPAHTVLRIGAILLVITGCVYALALRPRVIAGASGITIRNPFRDHQVPWTAIQGVDTGDWVKVYHTRDGSPVTAVEVPGKAIECWALYVSARMKRRAVRGDGIPSGAPRPKYGTLPLFGRGDRVVRMFGQENADASPKLPPEAKYLASLPPVKAIAVTLDARAVKERARKPEAGPVTVAWAWLPLAAVLVPALALLIDLLA